MRSLITFPLAVLSLLVAPGALAGPSLPGTDGLLNPESMLSGGFGAPPTGFGGSSAQGAEFQGGFSTALMFEDIGEDKFITLDLATTLSLGPLSLGVQIPISLRVIDNEPTNDEDLRMEDWDEASDFVRVMRFLELNLVGDTWGLRGRIGTLEGESIGHGTALAGYYNSIDRAHTQGGLALRTSFGVAGAEFMVDNIIAPEIVGSRLFIRPASIFTDASWATSLAFGVSYVADTNAPVSLSDSDPSNDVFDADLDDTGNYKVAGTAHVAIVGLDVEYAVVRNALIEFVPYVDLNILMDVESGMGIHAGAFFNMKLPTGLGPKLMTRIEYRYIGQNYVPRYIDSVYEAHRLMIPNTAGTQQTKLSWLRNGATGRHGWLGELYFDFAGWVGVGGSYEDYEGEDNSALTLSLILPKMDSLQAGAYYSHRGFESLADAFKMDGALLLAFLKSQIWGPVYATASYSRTWSIDEGGNYRSDDDWNVGLGMNFSY